MSNWNVERQAFDAVALSSYNATTLRGDVAPACGYADGPFATGPYADLGSYVEVTAATDRPINEVHVCQTYYNATVGGKAWLDIAVGGAGVEVVVARTVIPPFGSTLRLPLRLPENARVAVRVAGLSYQTLYLSIALVGASSLSPVSPAAWAVYGWGLAGTEVNVDAGGTALTWSAWTEVVPSAPANTSHLSAFAVSDSDAADGEFVCEIGVGGSGSQVSLYRVCGRSFAYGGLYPYTILPPTPVRIPTGAQVWWRHQSTSTATASTRVMRPVICLGY